MPEIQPRPSSGGHVGSEDEKSFYDDKEPTYAVDSPKLQDEVKPERGLKRDLKGRQISMIAIGGALGTGLVIGTGSGLSTGGPGSLLISFLVMGLCCAAVMSALGEMSTYMPHPRGFAGHASRFVSADFGLATGYNYLFKYLVVTATNVNAASLVIYYWNSSISGGVWIAIVIVLVFALNMAGPKWFGEVEFWLSLIKIITMTGLILLLLILDLGGGPSHDRIGFRNWKHGLAFKAYPGTSGSSGRFLGLWANMTTALFAYTGTELVGVTVGEAANPRKSVPAAIKKTFFRIIFFYIIGVLLVGMVVPSNSPLLSQANKIGTSAAASPFVVAINIARIQVLPDIINACILIFTISAANSDQYIASRTLYGLAVDGKAPRIFRKCNERGVPYWALCVTTPFCCLAFINLAAGGPASFKYLSSAVTVFGGTTWVCILVSHIRFMKAMKVQGMSRDSLPWKSPLQPYSSYFAVVVTSIVVFFKGWSAFLHTFKWRDFVSNYIGLPIFFALLIGWKLWFKTKVIPLQDVDLVSGAREFDEADEQIWKQDEEKKASQFQHATLQKKVWIYLQNW